MDLDPIATFSLVARDPDSGDLGVAVASKFLAVGAYVPYARAGVGAIATQAFMNATFGPRGLAILADGGTPDDCVAEFQATDDGISQRQVGIVAADGSSASFTGDDCHDWAGGRSGEGWAAQGNILAGADVVDALVDAFLGKEDLAFPERMAAALLAADRAGGDRRGRQSAALVVVGEGKGYAGQNDRWIDLRVDDHPDPIPELQRLLELHRLFMSKPARDPRDLSEADIAWLQQILWREGHLDAHASGTWDDATQHALASLFGVENLEERWLEGPRIDPVAWDYLRDTFGDGEG